MISDLAVLARIAILRGDLANEQRRIILLHHSRIVNDRLHDRCVIVGVRNVHQELENAAQRRRVRIANFDPGFVVRSRFVIKARGDYDLKKNCNNKIM